MQFVSWNVNGLRACLTKGFGDFFKRPGPTFSASRRQSSRPVRWSWIMPGYSQYWSYAEKKGYSGTAVFAREPALSVTEGLGDPALDGEGRILTLEYPDFYLVNCYTPNAQEGLKRLSHRMAWDDAYRAHLQALDAKKPVIACADYNVAHQEIDLKNPGPNRGSAGFSDEERERFSMLLAAGFTIPSATAIPTSPAPIPGGATASTPGRTMPDGESTTSWCRTG